MPEACAPDCATPCPICTQSNWEVIQGTVPSAVFLVGAVTYTRFSHCVCLTLDCNGRLEVDGQEEALLRQTARLAFSYELLYAWEEQFDRGGCPWFKFWLNNLALCFDLSTLELRNYMNNVRKHFQAATFNFVSLQRIDFHAAFKCSCEGGPLHVTADGLTLGTTFGAFVPHPLCAILLLHNMGLLRDSLSALRSLQDGLSCLPCLRLCIALTTLQ